MTKFQIVKVFLSYFVLYALIGVLSACIKRQLLFPVNDNYLCRFLPLSLFKP